MASAPAIIERASVDAYDGLSVASVRARVANATEGAAPNKPAKLFGLRMSPSAENADTTVPPIRKRNSITFNMEPCRETEDSQHHTSTNAQNQQLRSHSFIFAHTHTLLDASSCFLGSFSVQGSVFLTRHIVVVDEEFLHFLDKLLSEVVDVFNEREFVVILFDCNQTIIALFLLSIALFSFNHSDQSALYQATLQSRLVHQSQDIYR